MLQGTDLEFDVQQPESMKMVLPVAPIFANFRAADALIPIDYHYQPAWETPSFYSLQHIITIFVGQPTQVDRVVGRNTQQAIYAAGKVGIYPAYQSRVIRWDREAEFIDLYLAPKTIARYADPALEIDRYELNPRFATDDPLIYSLGLVLKQQVERGGCDVFYVESALTTLIAHLLRYYSTQPTIIATRSVGLNRAKLSEVTDYIQAHLDRNPSLVELAALVDLSSCHFVKVFKASMGITPHQYLLRCRIEKAKQLLIHKQLSLTEISHRVGFHDQSRFTSVFKQRIGMTPKQYRDRL